jgi:peptide chain release factor 1
MIERLQEILDRFEEIESQLQSPEVAQQPKELERLGKARAELEDVVTVVRTYMRHRQELAEAQELLSDPEMREMAEAEIEPLREKIESGEQELKVLLLPRDPNDEKNVIVDVRAVRRAPSLENRDHRARRIWHWRGQPRGVQH